MDIEKQECYGQMTGQSYIETDYPIVCLGLFIKEVSYIEPGLIQIILSFILHLNKRNGYYVNSLVCLLTGINITKLDTSYYQNYSNNVVCNRTIKKFENIKKIIDKVIEWYENCYVFEKYDKILESKQYSIKKNNKLLELMMNCNSYEDKLKLFNFNENYDHYTLLVLQKRISSIKLFSEFIKNNLPTIKFNKKYKKPKKQTINIDIEEEIMNLEDEYDDVVKIKNYNVFNKFRNLYDDYDYKYTINKINNYLKIYNNNQHLSDTIKLKKRNEKYLFKKKK